MLDSALLKTNFVGRDGFVWWIGRVADPSVWRTESTDTDAGWAFRCKVRIIGYHPFDTNVLPDEDLPWSHVLVDATSGSGQGNMGDSSRMMGGETVFGFFLDGEEGQQPVIFGALARSINSLGPKNTPPLQDDVGSENVFGILSGREAGVEGPTSLPLQEDKEGGSTAEQNADKEVGKLKDKETPSGDKVNAKDLEGNSKAVQSEGAFSNRGAAETITMDNACDKGNDALSEVTHTIGSFLKTVNGLTQYADQWIDTSRNLLVDIDKEINRASKLATGAMRKIVATLRDKITSLFSKRYRDFIGMEVTEAQKTPVVAAFKRIQDFVFCVFNKLGSDLLGDIKDMFKDMLKGGALNGTVCAIEQAVGALMAGVNDAIKQGLAPIIGGLDWLTGSISGVGSLLDKVGSYTDALMSFLDCDSLQCKEYEDWTQKGGLRKKPNLSFSSIIDNSKLLSSIPIDGIDGISRGLNQKFSALSLLNGNLPQLFDCNEKTNNPKNQDDLADSVPPGFVWPDCIPPKVEVYGDGTKTAAMIPIVSSDDGSILTLQIIEKGFGYTNPPVVSIIDKTNNGGGAQAQTVIDENGSVVDVYMISPGEGYCPSTNVVPPKYPVTEGPGIGITGGTGEDGTNLDSIDPFITFTTPSDDAVGVQTTASLSVTFNEPIVKGIGNITITETTSNAIHEIIPVNDKRVSFLSDRIIKIDPNANLKSNTEYFISMSKGSFKDLNDNEFAGMARTDTYNFTTRGVSGIGTQAVGIVTSLVPQKPGIGYTSGDTGQVGNCTFDLLLTPAGSIAGIRNMMCKDKHTKIPPVTINTKTGVGAKLLPVISYAPDFVSDIGERPAPGALVINVVDCVYSLPKTQIGWVNGNPYYGPFHIHPFKGVKMVGAVHVPYPHDVIYDTREESLGKRPPITYTPSSTVEPMQQQQSSETTETTETSTTMTNTDIPETTTTAPQTTQQPEPQQPQQPQQQQPPTPPPAPPAPPSPPPTPPSGGGGGGGYGGGY